MFSTIFSQQYLYGLSATGLSRSDKFIFILSLIIVAFGIFTVIYKKSLKDKLFKAYLSRWVVFFMTIGITGVIWTGLRYEMIQIFSTHLTIFVVIIIAVIWKLVLLRAYFKSYKPQAVAALRQQQLQKYM